MKERSSKNLWKKNSLSHGLNRFNPNTHFLSFTAASQVQSCSHGLLQFQKTLPTPHQSQYVNFSPQAEPIRPCQPLACFDHCSFEALKAKLISTEMDMLMEWNWESNYRSRYPVTRLDVRPNTVKNPWPVSGWENFCIWSKAAVPKTQATSCTSSSGLRWIRWHPKTCSSWRLSSFGATKNSDSMAAMATEDAARLRQGCSF